MAAAAMVRVSGVMDDLAAGSGMAMPLDRGRLEGGGQGWLWGRKGEDEGCR